MPRKTLWMTCLLLLIMGAAALACPACNDSVANTDVQQATTVGAGFNTSIYLMLGGFFAALGLVARTLIRAIRAS